MLLLWANDSILGLISFVFPNSLSPFPKGHIFYNWTMITSFSWLILAPVIVCFHFAAEDTGRFQFSNFVIANVFLPVLWANFKFLPINEAIQLLGGCLQFPFLHPSLLWFLIRNGLCIFLAINGDSLPDILVLAWYVVSDPSVVGVEQFHAKLLMAWSKTLQHRWYYLLLLQVRLQVLLQLIFVFQQTRH